MLPSWIPLSFILKAQGMPLQRPWCRGTQISGVPSQGTIPFKSTDSEIELLGFKSDSRVTASLCITLGELLNLSAPQFPRL